MTTLMSAHMIDGLWTAAKLEPGRPLPDVESRLLRIVEAGWVHSIAMSDLLEYCDHRLSQGRCGLDVDGIAEALGYRFEEACTRPRSISRSAGIFSAMRSSYLASLMCDLDAMGFIVPARRLCEMLRPKLDGVQTMSSADLSVLWAPRTLGHSQIILKSTSESPEHEYDEGRLPGGHRYFAVLDEEGKPLSVEIRGPKYRRRSGPSYRTCGECGTSYMHGDPESSAYHRKAHARVTRITKPSPSPRMIERQESIEDAEVVRQYAPKWMHREMYERAFAFKREMHYDFVQWSENGREDDPDARGHLFVDDGGTIHGACAFRIRRHDGGERWALQWVWVRPDARRSGILSARWNDLRRRYGDFHVEEPVSEAMQAFLACRGDSHLMERSVRPRVAEGVDA